MGSDCKRGDSQVSIDLELALECQSYAMYERTTSTIGLSKCGEGHDLVRISTIASSCWSEVGSFQYSTGRGRTRPIPEPEKNIRCPNRRSKVGSAISQRASTPPTTKPSDDLISMNDTRMNDIGRLPKLSNPGCAARSEHPSKSGHPANHDTFSFGEFSLENSLVRAQ